MRKTCFNDENLERPMRIAILILSLALAGCAAGGGAATQTPLIAADASTALITGERVGAAWSTHPAGEGQDPLNELTLSHADGRAMTFQESNHTPNDVMAQSAGGPLAQIMGLFGEETPTLYSASAGGAPFICAPEGPAALGYYEAPDGVISMVGLKQNIQFEARPDGAQEALPFSPDMVCARLKFRRG